MGSQALAAPVLSVAHEAFRQLGARPVLPSGR